MIEEEKNVLFSRNLYSLEILKLRFEKGALNDPPTPNFSLMHRKNKKQRRPFTFLLVAARQNDDDVIKTFYQSEMICTHSMSIPSFIII